MRALELSVPPPVIVLGCALTMWWTADFFPGYIHPVPGQSVIVSALIAVAGIFGVGAVLSFRRLRTTINPHHPESATAFVTDGVYRFSRNPMYLALLLILVAWAVRLQHLLVGLGPIFFVFYISRFQIAPEERALAAKFGPEYDSYMRKVRRWL